MSQTTDKVTFKISAAAAPYVGADKPVAVRLKAAGGKAGLSPQDSLLLVFYLCHDPDPEVKRTALTTLRDLDTGFVAQLVRNPELHPRILDLLVKLHFQKSELVPLFVAHPLLSEPAAVFLAEHGAFTAENLAADPAAQEAYDQAADAMDEASDEAADEAESAGEQEPEPEDEEFQSKYQLAQNMGIGDKIKMAMTGDKEWRGLLIKDSNKLVSSAVIKNPRMTEAEVLTIAKSAVQNDEILRVICANKEWVKNPQIRKALAENNKTPLPAALRFVSTLSVKDLSLMAKSKNISSVIASQARRILLTKNKDK